MFDLEHLDFLLRVAFVATVAVAVLALLTFISAVFYIAWWLVHHVQIVW